MTLVVSIHDSGFLTGLQLLPASAAAPVAPWKPPDYADPDSFYEQEVSLDGGRLAVPGTLSLPRRPGPWPAIVLMAGSGPMDRDETIGRNKPLKDLAWGLASRGVAVLRFDKVTYVHPDEIRQLPGFTALNEYGPDTGAAVDRLREHPSVLAEWVFLLGHSLGGTMAPRVATTRPSVAGIVILAGGAEPLHWAAVRQDRYLASLRPEAQLALAATVETMSEQALLVDSPGLSDSTPSSKLPLGVPAAYWLDLRGYDPVASARALDRPILILQGGRDYQATVADDLARWEAGLAGHPDVTVHVYPADNHLFFPGTGPSTPEEYEPVQHMDPDVIADIAHWLPAQVPGSPTTKA